MRQEFLFFKRACSYIAVHIDICAEWPFFEISSWNFACGTVAPPYTLCMSLSQIGEKKTTIFSPLLIALKFGIYDFLTEYMKKQISKNYFFKNCAIASNFFPYFWADWAEIFFVCNLCQNLSKYEIWAKSGKKKIFMEFSFYLNLWPIFYLFRLRWNLVCTTF